MARHNLEYGTDSPIPRRHGADDACWCEPVTLYVSQATGAKVTLHRAFDKAGPSAGLLADSRRLCDMPNAEEPEDWL